MASDVSDARARAEPPARPPAPRGPGARSWRPAAFALVVLGLMTLGEIRLRQRLLYANQVELAFVEANLIGIRTGRPAFEAWQHRVLTPALVSVVGAVVGSERRALELFSSAMVAAANLLFFAIVRRKGGSRVQAVLAVAALGYCRLLLTYKLEYPWDGVDVLLFLFFGYWVSRDRPLLPLAPLLLVGALNHETVLYLPLWYLLSPLARPPVDSAPRGEGRPRFAVPAVAALAMVLIGAVVFGLRAGLHVGPAALPGQTFDAATPVLGNVLHARHNFWQLAVEDWRHGHALLNAGIMSAVVLLMILGARAVAPRAAAWSAVVVATIFCFGYMSETRLYLPLMAFWFAHGWPSVAAAPPAPNHVAADTHRAGDPARVDLG